jgi:hypothetical protein
MWILWGMLAAVAARKLLIFDVAPFSAFIFYFFTKSAGRLAGHTYLPLALVCAHYDEFLSLNRCIS